MNLAKAHLARDGPSRRRRPRCARSTCAKRSKQRRIRSVCTPDPCERGGGRIRALILRGLTEPWGRPDELVPVAMNILCATRRCERLLRGRRPHGRNDSRPTTC